MEIRTEMAQLINIQFCLRIGEIFRVLYNTHVWIHSKNKLVTLLLIISADRLILIANIWLKPPSAGPQYEYSLCWPGIPFLL